MKRAGQMAAVALAAGMTFAFAGCDKSRDEMRPDMDAVMNGDHGPQCADLREMASRMAPKVLQCDDVVHNPYKIVVVMKNMDNKTEDMPGRDMDIYLARLVGDLNTAASSDRIAFREEAAKVQQFQQQELGNRDPFEDAARTGQPANTMVTAQYVMYGTVYSQKNGRTNYYLFQFHLTNLQTGIQVWSDQYDVRTLN